MSQYERCAVCGATEGLMEAHIPNNGTIIKELFCWVHYELTMSRVLGKGN